MVQTKEINGFCSIGHLMTLVEKSSKSKNSGNNDTWEMSNRSINKNNHTVRLCLWDVCQPPMLNRAEIRPMTGKTQRCFWMWNLEEFLVLCGECHGKINFRRVVRSYTENETEKVSMAFWTCEKVYRKLECWWLLTAEVKERKVAQLKKAWRIRWGRISRIRR